MKANRKNTHGRTLDLFSPRTSGTNAPAGDGLPEDGHHLPEDGHPGATSPETAAPDVALPALSDIVVRRTEPFRVPGLTSPVLPVPVFRVQLVRERDHLTRMVQSPEDAARLCSEMLEGYDREVFLVIALSTANRVIGAHVAHVGTVDASIASPREVFKFALLVNARSVICAHNHPSGNLEPSKADVAVSKGLKAAGEAIGVRLLDSLVIGHPSGKKPAYTSLADRGLL